MFRSVVALSVLFFAFEVQALTFKSGQTISGGDANATKITDEVIDACKSDDFVTATGKPMQVMSFNIRYDNSGDGGNSWPNRTDKVASMFTTHDVSLGGLQEVLHHQFTWLQDNLGDYEFVGVGRDDGKTEGEYAPIFYRKSEFEMVKFDTVWLSATPDKAGSKGWDAALPRITTFATLRHNDSGKLILLGSAHYDHRGTIAKRKSGEVIHNYITKEMAENDIALVLLTGDFNDTPNTSTTRELENKNCLFDSRRMADETAGPNSTWNGFRSVAAYERIDYIFMTPAAHVFSQVIDDRRIDGGFPSDHLPVIVSFATPE